MVYVRWKIDGRNMQLNYDWPISKPYTENKTTQVQKQATEEKRKIAKQKALDDGDG